MLKVFSFILSLSLLIACTSPSTGKSNSSADSSGGSAKPVATIFDSIDAYQLTLDGSFVFGSLNEFIDRQGLPQKAKIDPIEFPIKTSTALQQVLNKPLQPGTFASLYFPGYTMLCVGPNRIALSYIDFRKTGIGLKSGSTVFDSKYMLQDFHHQFPSTGTERTLLPQSFFEMATGEHLSSLKHFLLKRRSKEKPDATPLVEFTFKDDKLVFIYFVNF